MLNLDFLNFKLQKERSLAPREEHPYTPNMLGGSCMESRWSEKDLEVPVNTMLNMSKKSTLAAKKNLLEKVLPLDQWGYPFPLLSTGEAIPGVLCPVLGSSGQDRPIGESGTTKATKGAAASLI